MPCCRLTENRTINEIRYRNSGNAEGNTREKQKGYMEHYGAEHFVEVKGSLQWEKYESPQYHNAILVD
jgi:hypothetical protein